MTSYKFITSTLEGSNTLSSTAVSIALLLVLHADQENLVHREHFIRSVGLKMDPRTWSKYWRELESKQILASIESDRGLWMLSPYQCYTEGVPKTALISKWNEVCSAAG